MNTIRRLTVDDVLKKYS